MVLQARLGKVLTKYTKKTIIKNLTLRPNTGKTGNTGRLGDQLEKLEFNSTTNVALDFKGPIAKHFYFLLVIDEYSRFPEVAVLDSTGAANVIPHYDCILSTHGIPEQVKTDNGPPFNSDFSNYAEKRGFKHRPVTPKQQSSNGLTENFMKMLQKVAHRLCRA